MTGEGGSAGQKRLRTLSLILGAQEKGFTWEVLQPLGFSSVLETVQIGTHMKLKHTGQEQYISHRQYLLPLRRGKKGGGRKAAQLPFAFGLGGIMV